MNKMNKRERVKAVMERRSPDYVPAGFWFHYNGSYTVEEMAEAHLKLYRETDMDIIKIMQDYMYPVEGKITCAEDWYQIGMQGTDSEVFHKLSDVIKKIRKEAGDDVMIFQTMFGPFKAASIAYGDDVLMKYAREAPEAVMAGVGRLAAEMERWAQGFLDAGADGIYYSAQFGEVGRFTKEEWKALVMPYDLQVLNAVKKAADRYVILHICGEPDYDFATHIDRFIDYPADLVNWSVKDNHYSLERGRDFFKAGILGGMDNKGNILKGPAEQIRKEVKEILDHYGTRGIMLGADCTIQGEGIRLDYIREAVTAAHQYTVHQ